MIQIRHERLSDVDRREALLDQAFGETRYRKSSERLREDRLPAEGLSFIAAEGQARHRNGAAVEHCLRQWPTGVAARSGRGRGGLPQPRARRRAGAPRHPGGAQAGL